jgi:hypothetical protein
MARDKPALMPLIRKLQRLAYHSPADIKRCLRYPWIASGPSKAQADALYRAAYADAPHVSFVDIGDAAHFVMLD